MNEKRIIQLLELGFERNDDQQSLAYSFKDAEEGHIYVDFRMIEDWPDTQWDRFYEMWKEIITGIIETEKYERAILCYGIAPMLIILEEFEKADNYEVCNIILKAIKNLNTSYSVTLEMKYSENTLPDLKQELNRMGFAGDIVIQNMPYYVEKVRELLK